MLPAALEGGPGAAGSRSAARAGAAAGVAVGAEAGAVGDPVRGPGQLAGDGLGLVGADALSAEADILAGGSTARSRTIVIEAGAGERAGRGRIDRSSDRAGEADIAIGTAAAVIDRAARGAVRRARADGAD